MRIELENGVLRRRLLQVGNQGCWEAEEESGRELSFSVWPCSLTVALVLLLQAGEDHLGARDELLGVRQVLEQGLLVPGDACTGRKE